MLTLSETDERELQLELARIDFWAFCQIRLPKLYTDDKVYLRDLCDRLQSFVETSPKHFLVVNIPPRHLKSLTGQLFTQWLFGKNNRKRVMTGSYNERLSGIFARSVRNAIQTIKTDVKRIVYSDVFPETKVKQGEASAAMWSLESSDEVSYLATSPGGTATGIGVDYLIVDDVIKSAKEAYNELTLDDHWEWFTNTMMQRTEGDDWKVIVIMTRWATGDLAGRVIEAYGDDVELVSYKAVQDDGTMLCDAILSRESFTVKTLEMNEDIVEANYNQQPIDIKGRLYTDFITYEELPEVVRDLPTYSYTDTADRGNDFLCSVAYKVHDGDVYVTGVVISDDDMETTEPLVVDLFIEQKVTDATIESNNGGRGFRRNIERVLKETHGYFKCSFTDLNQSSNKEARILTSSSWCQHHIMMPYNWKQKFPKDFKDQLLKYNKKGKNPHDDAPDVLAGIYEAVTNDNRIQFFNI